MSRSPGNPLPMREDILRPWQTDPVILRILRNAGYLPRPGLNDGKPD